MFFFSIASFSFYKQNKTLKEWKQIYGTNIWKKRKRKSKITNKPHLHRFHEEHLRGIDSV